MEYTRDDLDPANKHLSIGGYGSAPREMFAAMLALADPADVIASLVDASTETDRSEWRALWLTESRLIACTVSADRRGWDYSSHPVDLVAEVSAWSVPLTAIESVGVTRARTGNAFGAGWSADVVYELSVKDRGAVSVPLFGDFAHSYQHSDCEKFLVEFRRLTD